MSYLKIGKYFGVNQGFETYQTKEVLDEGYADITNVYHWFKLDELDKDFLYRRQMAIEYIISVGGFDNLSELDKSYAAKNYCVGPIDRDKIFTNIEQEEYWYHFVVNSESCRKDRWDKAKSFASYRLSITDSSDLAVSTSLLNENFIKYGIENFAEDNQDGLFDWLKSEGNFTANGFSSKSYYTEELKNGIINKLNGL
jgi:hypothetical protein